MILGRGSGVSATSTHTKSSNSLPRPLEHRTASAVAAFVFAASALSASVVASAVASTVAASAEPTSAEPSAERAVATAEPSAVAASAVAASAEPPPPPSPPPNPPLTSPRQALRRALRHRRRRRRRVCARPVCGVWGMRHGPRTCVAGARRAPCLGHSVWCRSCARVHALLRAAPFQSVRRARVAARERGETGVIDGLW